MYEENGLGGAEANIASPNDAGTRERQELLSDRVTVAQAFGQLPVAPPAQVNAPAARADIPGMDKALIFQVEGVKTLRLPAGTSLDDIKIVDDDVILVQPNGAPPIVLDGGAKYLPDIVIGDVEIPRAAFVAAFQQAGIEPAAGPEVAESAGSDGSVNVPDIGPFLGISPLLPPTDLSFDRLERREDNPSGFLAEVEPPAVVVIAGLDVGRLIVKEDGFATVTLEASAAPGSDDLISSVEISGLNPNATYIIAGVTVTGETTYTVPFSGQNQVESFEIQVQSSPDDADADLGSLVATATAIDPIDPTLTATSEPITIPVIVDAVLDLVATPDQAVAPSLTEDTDLRYVNLGLSLTFVPTDYPDPADQPFDGTPGDVDSSTYAVTIAVSGDAVDLRLNPDFKSANPGVTLTETAPGVWTLAGTNAANLAAAVAAVQAIVPANTDGSVTGTITAVSTDLAPGGEEVDFSDNSQTASDTWSLNITPDVDPPTVAVTAGLTDGKLIVKEDGTATVSLQASVAPGTDDLLTKATITGLSSTAEYVINGTNVTGQTSYVLNFAGTNPSEAITIQVISQVDDADADLGTIQVVATAKDGNNAATTANSAAASVPVVVDAVLDRFGTPDQASPASAAEQTSSQAVSLGLSLSFTSTAYAAPANQFYDGSPGVDANETFAVKITVAGDAVNLTLDPLTVPAGVTLTEGPAGTWTLNGTTAANVQAAVASVQAVVPANYDTAVTGSIEVVSNDPVTDTEVALGDNTETRSDTWSLNITPDVDPPTVAVTAGLTDGKLIVKEDGTATVSLQASVAPGTDDLLTKATITGLSSTAEYVINGTNVTGQTSYVLNFAGTNPSEAITIQVISQVDDADADLGTIQVVATAKDGNNAATTANSAAASVPVVVDAVLDRFGTPDQASPASAAEQTSSQAVSLGLSLSFTSTAYAAPANQFYDGSPGVDANETFAVKITVAGDAVNLTLDPLTVPAGVTLTEGPAGTWTLNGTTAANVQAAVASVQAVVPANYDTAVTGSIEVVSNDPVTDTEVALGDNTETRSDTWSLNITPDVDPPTVAVTAGLTDGKLIVKEDGTATVSLQASVAPGTDDLLTKATITGLSSTAEYVINGTNVTGQTSYVLNFAGTNPSEAITIQVISQVDDADADLGTIQVVATAKDGNNAATTANSAAASVPVVVDAVLDRFGTPDQASPASAAEQTSSQAVSLGLSLSFTSTAYAAPANQFYDGSPGVDANETFAVKITVAGDAVNLTLDPLTVPAGVTLTEGPAGTWTLNGTTAANVQAAVASVQAVVPANYDTAVTGSIEVVSNDPVTDTEVALGDNTETRSDTWSLNITPDVDPPTVAVTAGLTDGKLIVKEDGTATVSLQASVAPGTDDLLTKATITGLSSTAEYVINGTNVTGQTSYVLNFAGTNPSEAITIQVISQVDDADADLGTIQVVATAKDGNNAATTANSAAASVPVVVDAVLDRFGTPDQASPASAAEQTSSQAVSLGLSLSFTSTAYAAPANQFYDGSPGVDANETFAVKITVAGDAVNLTLDPLTVPAGVTLTEGPAGTWTLNGTTAANVQAAVASVQAVVPANYDTAVTGSIEVVSNDPVTDTEVALGDNTETRSDTWSLNITDSGVGAAGSVALTVYEAGLDKDKDGADLAAGDVVGSNPTGTSETAQGTGLTFTAGGDPITSITFADPTGANAPTVNLPAGYTVQWAVVGGQLVGTVFGPGNVDLGPAIYVGLSGQLTATEGQQASPTVTVTLSDRLEHADALGSNTLVISNISIVAADSDGSTAKGTATVTVYDDLPTTVSPEYGVLVNAAGSTFNGALDFDKNLENNYGADGGTIRFASSLDGVNSGLTSGGQAIIYDVTNNGLTLLGKVGTTTIFTVALNPDGSAISTNDTYTVTMSGTVDGGASTIDFNAGGYDFVGGNRSFVSFSKAGDDNSLDLLLTARVGNTLMDSTINTTATSGGVGSGTTVGTDGGQAETFRIDFVVDIGKTAGPYNGTSGQDLSDLAEQALITFDKHYNANGATAVFDINNGTTKIQIAAFDDTDNNDGLNNNATEFLTGDGTPDSITKIGLSLNGATPTEITSSGTYVVGGRSYDVVFSGGLVTIDGDIDGLTVGTFTSTGYTSLEYTYISGTPFQIGDFGVTAVDPGKPVNLALPIEIVDGDGDVSSSSIGVTLAPSGGTQNYSGSPTGVIQASTTTDPHIIGSAQNDTLTGNTADNVLYGAAGNDNLNGGGGADLLVGGAGIDTLVGDIGIDILIGGLGADSLSGGGGKDTFVLDAVEIGVHDLIADYNLADGDVIDLSSLINTAAGVDPETAGYVNYDAGTGALYVDQNGGGDNFVQVAQLSPATISINILYSNNGSDAPTDVT